MYQSQSPRPRNHVTLPSARTHFMQNGAPPPSSSRSCEICWCHTFYFCVSSFSNLKEQTAKGVSSWSKNLWRRSQKISKVLWRKNTMEGLKILLLLGPTSSFAFLPASDPDPTAPGQILFSITEPLSYWSTVFYVPLFFRWSAGRMWSSWVSMWRSSVTATFLLLVILTMLMSNTNGIKSLLSRGGYIVL